MLHRSSKWKLISATSVLLTLSACGSLNIASDKELNIKRYEISLPQNLQKKLDSQKPSLLIYPVKTGNTYNTQRIAYSLSPYEISYYAQSEWADSPGHLLLPLLAAGMESSGQFSAVVSSGSAAITDLALDVELLSLVHQYQQDSSKISLSMRVQLIDLRKRSVLATDTFVFEESAKSNDPYGAVVATNIAAGKLINRIQEFVKQSQINAQ